MGWAMDQDKSELVVVASAATLEEAQVIRAVLAGHDISAHVQGATATAMMPHIALAINPRGVRVMVLARDLDRVKRVLATAEPVEYEDREIEERDAAAFETSPDRYARSAYRASLLYLICPLILLLVPYYFCRALRVSRRQPVRNKRRFRRHMVVALIVGILIPWFCILWVLGWAAIGLVGTPTYYGTSPASAL